MFYGYLYIFIIIAGAHTCDQIFMTEILICDINLYINAFNLILFYLI